MNTAKQATIIRADNEQRQAVIALLQSENLPVEDLPGLLDDFFVAIAGKTIVGAIGLEQYGKAGLLRSLVVNKTHRNKNIASQLISRLEKHAVESGVDTMYLLTETAPQYFETKGYRSITREEVPTRLQTSSEFSHVCPASAIVMKKVLDKNQQMP